MMNETGGKTRGGSAKMLKSRIKSLLLLVLAIGVLTSIIISVFHSRTLADFDPPGPPAVTDFIDLRKLSFLTSQDDGGFLGIGDEDAEICITLTFTHPEHPLGGGKKGEAAKHVKCLEDVNMASPDKSIGEKLDPPFELIGEGKLIGRLEGPPHDECVPTASWQFTIEVTELDSGIGTILELLGSVLGLVAKIQSAGTVNQNNLPNLNASEDLKKIGEKIEEILGKQTFLGFSTETWEGGVKDPEGEEPKSFELANFKYVVVKVVKKIQGGEVKCPSPTPTPTPTPTPRPPDPPEDPFCLDLEHLFSSSILLAAESWQLLRTAAELIDMMAAEGGEGVSMEDVEEQKLLARELVALIGRLVAAHEVAEASEMPGSVSQDVLNEAIDLLAEGDSLRDEALALGDTQLLLSALDRYQEAFELLAPLLHFTCSELAQINSLVTFNPIKSTFKTTSDTSGCSSGFVGKFSFNARLTNKNTSPPLSDLIVQVKTLTNGNLLQNADRGPAGEGTTLAVPQKDGFSDGLLSPGEFVDVPFFICLKEKKKFSFFVDVLGIPKNCCEFNNACVNVTDKKTCDTLEGDFFPGRTCNLFTDKCEVDPEP